MISDLLDSILSACLGRDRPKNLRDYSAKDARPGGRM